ncbi:hypothetical protein SETIT_1G084800v2 [Setaria italica]|uniref:Leucine-rich repeat-containing N-terminal plant-type domain-containing protein n=1 Tax=Setaria italica TaxID=4555 RepID=A0A368PIY0_SETIT|nr:hypothetical protein SETIT_1G084800v2 [Setaria italica]
MQSLHSSWNNKRTRLPPPIHLLGLALLLLPSLPSPTSSCTKQEKVSLLRFLEGLSQDSGLTASWRNDTNCCMWKGIICDADDAVKEISLASMSLEGRISSASLGNLTSMLSLNLSCNSLSGDLPEELLLSRSMVVFDVSFNNLNGDLHKLPSTTGRPMQLRTIILRGNSFHGELNNVNFSTLSDLKILDFMLNKFTGTVPESLYFCSNLIALRLSSNNFHGNLKSLKFLSLTNNSFTNITNALQVLKSSWNLTTLLIGTNFKGNNKFSGVIPMEIGHLKGLAALNLSFNNLHGEVPQSNCNLTNLRVLELSNNHLTGEIPAALENLHFLSFFF